MTRLRLLPLELEARRLETAHGTSLAPTMQGLAAELEPLMERDLPIPPQKARLTRVGGRCPTHGVLLEFDPWSPLAHRCERCDQTYTGAEHDDWWAMGAQLYTAERAVHAATLYAMRGDPRHADLALRILGEFLYLARIRTLIVPSAVGLVSLWRKMGFSRACPHEPDDAKVMFASVLSDTGTLYRSCRVLPRGKAIVPGNACGLGWARRRLRR